MTDIARQERDYIVLYGSLRAEADIRDKPDLRRLLRPAGEAVVKGRLVDLGEYPGLVPGDGDVRAELFEVVDREAFRVMDDFERYDPNAPSESLYLRRAVRLDEPNLDAWVYLYNREWESAPEIPNGDWLAYLSARQAPDEATK